MLTAPELPAGSGSVLSYRLGIDIGSVTAKVAVLDARGEIVFSAYRRHRAEIPATLCSILREASDALGDVSVSSMITGSAGMGMSSRYGIPFIQEMIAAAEVIKRRYPQVRTLIDIGGEDAKLIYFDRDGIPDMRMNGTCAGGTGAYIDEMATLLNVPVGELGALAERSTQVYPMASRCGVFGKTDVQNLLSRQVPHPDIAASILHAVVLQIMATLARGLEPEPMILFSGGPLTFIPTLRAAFMKELDFAPDDVLDAPHMELLSACGAALAQGQGAGATPTRIFGKENIGGHPKPQQGVPPAPPQLLRLSELIELLSARSVAGPIETHRLAPLFADEAEWENWEKARWQHRIERVPVHEVEGEPCFLGVDSGSTTTKMVLIDRQGRLVFTHYTNNGGDAIGAARDGLEKLRQEFAACDQPPRIVRSAATGYGEDLVRTAFGLDEGIVETVAHFRGAKAFDPDVSFILDIGGQDMKAIFVRDGYICNIELNEACSSGCGTFIQTFAHSMGHNVADFARMACTSRAPCDLGTRCTVFMNSSIKQALKEAAGVDDISAGLAYSVIKNALHKVLRITDTAVLGEHIVVQGGTFRNPAVHRALENLLGRQLRCPDIAELMGAYGAALRARDAWLRVDGCELRVDDRRPMTKDDGRCTTINPQPSTINPVLASLDSATDYVKRTIGCRGCENRCTVTKLKFANGGVFVTGNRCERIYSNHGRQFVRGTSLTDRKLELLFQMRNAECGMRNNALTLGLPRVMNMYENFPFWNTLLVECGFRVQLSDPSSPALHAKGVGTVMSENICFPAKVVHGHIENLAEKRVDRIFYPMVFSERAEFADSTNSYDCPIVTGYPDVIRSAMDPLGKHGIPLDMPSVTFKDEKLLRDACSRYLGGLGVRRAQFKRAFDRALKAQAENKQAVREAGKSILEHARKEGRLVILLMGRSYHLDPLISHGVAQMLVDLGVDVITEDAVPLDPPALLENRHVPTQWEAVNRFYHAARWAGQQENVEVVQLNSFGCGPDAFTVDEVRSILASMGKGHTAIRIDEIESTGSVRLRLRSLIETLRSEHKPVSIPRPRKQIKLFEAEDRRRTVLIPHFSHFCAPIIAGPMIQMGFNVETLPPSDRESVEIGLKYVPNEVCYPSIIVAGDIIKALQSGRYDPAQVAVGSWQTGGPCRASSILSLVRKGMIAAGFEDVPIVALTMNRKLHEQPGNNLNYLEYVPKALMACVYGDAISAMYYPTAIREVNKGEALALADELLEPLNRGAMPLDQQSVLARLRDAVGRFNDVPTNDRRYPKVGVVGEIYVKYNSFSNNQVAQWLMEHDVEVITPDFLTFFIAWFVSSKVWVRENLARRGIAARLVYNLLERRAQGIVGRAEEVTRGFKYHRPSHTLQELARTAERAVSLTHCYGESWLIAGEIGALVESGVPNVICLQPFGCLANQVTARGIARRMKEQYEGLNVLFLDVDAGMSEVNYFNRLHFFLSQARGNA
jgi:predicted CoA-substrate-specific enzyme activase